MADGKIKPEDIAQSVRDILPDELLSTGSPDIPIEEIDNQSKGPKSPGLQRVLRKLRGN